MPYLIGVLLALVIGIGARLFGLDRDRVFYPVVMTTVGTYDIVFAIADGSLRVVLFEVGVLAVLAVLMVIGFRRSPWWVVGGLAGHGLLDVVHNHVIVNDGIPAWWPAFCATIDIALAAVLAVTLVRAGRRPATAGATTATRTAIRVAAAVALLGTGAVPGVMAQDTAPARARPAASLTVSMAQPVGALGDNIDAGYGASASFLLPVTRSGSLSLRFDIGAAEYGHEEARTQFSESVGGRVEVDVRTVNTIVPGSVGVMWTAQGGAVRPYLTTGVGAHVFYTESRVEPITGGTALASTINQSDVALAWMAGGGFNIPVSAKVQVDVGASYSRGGRAEYLAPGSISDLPGGGIAISPMTSSTELVIVRVGARITL